MTTLAERLFSRAAIGPYRILSWPVSLIATRLVVDNLRDLPAGSRVIDVGIGTGITASRLVNELGFKVTGIDASRDMLKVARGRLPDSVLLFYGDAVNLPFPAGAFDAAVYNYVLRYVPLTKTKAALSEAARLVHPGGRVIITDLNLPRLRPNGQPLGESIEPQFLGVWSLFSKGEFIKYAESVGLRHVKTIYPLFSFMMVFVRQ